MTRMTVFSKTQCSQERSKTRKRLRSCPITLVKVHTRLLRAQLKNHSIVVLLLSMSQIKILMRHSISTRSTALDFWEHKKIKLLSIVLQGKAKLFCSTEQVIKLQISISSQRWGKLEEVAIFHQIQWSICCKNLAQSKKKENNNLQLSEDNHQMSETLPLINKLSSRARIQSLLKSDRQRTSDETKLLRRRKHTSPSNH